MMMDGKHRFKMPAKGTQREYRGKACHRCHKQKVKCSREKPCRNCALAKRPCTYATRDKRVTVPESYLKRLESALAGSATPGDATSRPHHDTGSVSQSTVEDHPRPTIARQSFDPLVENSTAEHFVSKLKQIHKSKPSPAALRAQPESLASPDSDSKLVSAQPPTYEYFALNFDTSHAKCTFQLPPYPYAVHLLNQFSIFVGEDWHLFRIRTFRQRLENIYRTVDSAESKDRIWLCQLLGVFTLGLSISGHGPYVHQSPPPTDRNLSVSRPPPGMKFFEPALEMLKVPFEEVSVEHIETMNLMALCSYALNRQKTAYMYSGLSSRMCNMLELHKTSTSLDSSPLEQEHRKRVWWSTFCIDRMASSQMGLVPSLQVSQTDLEYPSEQGLLPGDVGEFRDPDYLTARVQLTIIQAENASNACHFGDDDAKDIEGILLPMLRRLDGWKAGLPTRMAVGLLEDGVPPSMREMPYLRSLANLHLRFNQCLILLLRPLLLQQIACIFSNEKLKASQKDLCELNNTCLSSARTNVRILIDLRACGLLARLGFMENMHLFTSLMIMCLAKSINTRRPHSFNLSSEESFIYETGKDVLRDMIAAGSLAGRGHESMLQEVEALGRSIELDGPDSDDSMVEQWDIDEWMTQLFEGENILDGF